MKQSIGLCLFLLCLLVFSVSCAEGKNRALLIGCDHFLSQEDTYPASSENVAMMADALSGGSMNLQQLVTRRTGLSGVREMQEMIDDVFSDAKDEDVSYLYISTHGVWNMEESNERMTLLLSDGFHEEGLTAKTLHDILEDVRGTKVLILDVCHAGAMIGKGVPDRFSHVFTGSEYKVLCSSGGAQQSWFWAGSSLDGTRFTAGGYFSDVLASGISMRSGFAADMNDDGVITLSEIKKYLRQMHGASIVQTYPEEDTFPFLSYDAESVRGRTSGPIGDVYFEDDLLDPESSEVHLSFIVYQTLRMAYQVVYQKEGRWDFEHANFFYDTGEMFGAFGDAAGFLTPGIKERTIQIQLPEEEIKGYILLQLVVQSPQGIQVVASHVLGVVAGNETPKIEIEIGREFSPSSGEELGIILRHNLPMQLTVYIETEDGQPVCRLMNRVLTRPEEIVPEATTLFWNGQNSAGESVEKGAYRMRIRAFIPPQSLELVSGVFYVK